MPDLPVQHHWHTYFNGVTITETKKLNAMNLFYDPSIVGLRQLIDTADKSLPANNIVVDYDGEVIIDPEKKFADISLNRFKFHTQISQAVKADIRSLKHLYETLLSAYSSNNHKIEVIRGWKNIA